MRIFGLAGWSGSGKTTLLAALIPEFVARGLTVSTIKHAHHEFDIDQPGKDSWRHRQAGAREVMVASSRRWALMHERVVPVVEEEIGPLALACGRILARDLVADMDVPPHANSAVDGFAVAHADLLPDRETVLPIAGRAAAGHPLGRAMRRGEA